MVEKFRIGLALQPVATALFANSPFKEGRPTGYLSWRSHVWTDVDNDRRARQPACTAARNTRHASLWKAPPRPAPPRPPDARPPARARPPLPVAAQVRHAAVCVRARVWIRAVRGICSGRAHVLCVPQRSLPRRQRPVLPGLPPGPAARPAGCVRAAAAATLPGSFVAPDPSAQTPADRPCLRRKRPDALLCASCPCWHR